MSAGISNAVFSPDGEYLVSTSSDETVRLWQVNGTGTDSVVLNIKPIPTVFDWSPGRKLSSLRRCQRCY